MGYLNLVFLLLQTAFGEAEKCRVLALEGGGSRGAYQAGVIRALASALPVGEREWNVVSGVSTGALNACGCAQFHMGREKEMSDFLVETWKSLNGSESTYVKWPHGDLEGLFFRPSLYDSSPLHEFIKNNWRFGINRNFTIAATDFNNATLRVFTAETPAAEVPDVVMSSAAPPFFFPPRHYQNTIYVDGGCLVNLDLTSPINFCLKAGFPARDIVVDMVFLTASRLPKAANRWSPLKVHSRVKEIRQFDGQTWFAYYVEKAFPEVDFRYTLVPSKEMPGGEIPLDFDRDNIEGEIDLGEKDALNVVSNGRNGLKPLLGRTLRAAKAFRRSG